ncbi:hypothetical protein FH972_022968 [Carpinus fangiana]|uniref:Uncharacterized protein n=1 Tax=Carpinus fangiana TaxID=176857 RepID=A0A5N6KU35_9ROSI|nr:hypothetical protein FH972_022968 [Carpinus fangiana]
MAHLTYFSYEGFGQTAKASSWYNQAVRIGDKIECAGQGASLISESSLPEAFCLTETGE